MIQANGLRIGNWVQTHPSAKIEQVYDLMCDCINTKTKEKLPFDCVDPILLTPEILEKCGLIKCNGYPYKFLCGYLKLRNGVFFFKYFGIEIELFYLHQLQNLYFALTGEELQCNL